ncbi:Glycosyltransferase involved in cell wall bisynthesis [Micromonospora pallida]|uniref:Glycosyltransferase involved in cell wall bisynthesis n=1 Tax=Micromonospora pallida TaxID=145854 RepID=A0A1C6S4X8_9ACTN|nr:glycosyltransferase family 4 protein [Micromonospora pallida]SCL24499.1 Glycosyltransferase involved in cell wall bisynthesis [Micromonospora pallida]
MRVGVLTYHFPPEPAFLPGSLAEALAARGHEVRVLTGFPHHPGGRIHPGWQQHWRYETRSERLTVRRVPRYSADSSPRARLAGQLTFATAAALAGRRFLAGIDVLHVCQVPAATLAAEAVRQVLPRVPFLLHVQDVRPRAELTGEVGGAGTAAVLRRLLRDADAIAVGAPSMRDLVTAAGADPSRVRLVLPWTDERIFRPVRPSPAAQRLVGGAGRCVVMHAGTIGERQRLETAVRAAAAVPDRVDLVLVGSGADEPRIRELVGDWGVRNVRFVDRRSPTEMADLYAVADYQLVTLRDLPELRGVVPAKLPAAFSCAAPVIAAAAGDTVAMVERARAGLSCPPEDWASLADRFWLAATIPAEARTEMGRRGRETYQRHMSMRAGVDRIEQTLYDISAPDH